VRQRDQLLDWRRMDNAELNDVILNAAERQFWIVQWGDPDHSPDEDTQVFNLPAYEQGLPKNPKTMRVGDILFVHRIHVSKIIFVAETVAPPRKSTEEESRRESWRQRWKWSVSTKNLTRTYGAYWKRYEVKAFDLAKEYNKLNPQEPVNIRTLNFGNYVRISEVFAKFLLNEIIRLPSPVARKQ
jgi:hypothetical protein